MKHAVPAAPAPVDGFAARAHARALRVDLGRHGLVLKPDPSWLRGQDAPAGSQARFR